jgi:hypothetical protein
MRSVEKYASFFYASHKALVPYLSLPQTLDPPSIEKVSIMVAAGLDLSIDLADGVVSGARSIEPFGNVAVRSTSDIVNIDVAGGVVVANLVATVVDGALGCALSGRNFVRKRHARES